ncbi:hypothetical protein DQT32_04825 [Salmonella enterica subsp. enterica serovar Braenderup]|nr:hypothetical protein [Salmonella enterica subsp. enterica serovar Braenderup]
MKTYITGPILVFDIPNANGNVYSREMCQSALDLKHKINTESVLGELDNQRSPNIDLDKVCSKIVDIDINLENIEATVEVLPTTSGNQLQEMLNEGVEFYLAARGYGQIDHNNVISNYELITVDVMPLHCSAGTRTAAKIYQK